MTRNASVPSTPPGAYPVVPNPFQFSVNFEGASETWYIPLVYLGQGTSVQMYVNYYCSDACGSYSISSLRISSDLPDGYSIASNGKVSKTIDVSFSSASIVNLENLSETVLYVVSIASTSSGFYTFSLPSGCTPEPVLYIKTGTTSYAPLANWLRSLNSADIGCSDAIETTILGFTNSYYTQIPILVNSSSS